MTDHYDIAIIGGGIMGCASALQMVAGGMRPIVLDQRDLGQGASGVNAGTLSLQIKRVKLMPYALRGHHEWEAMGDAVGFRKTGGTRWPSPNARWSCCTSGKS
jgi:glycine/D-amino acid oxidase-like deaminating enzyme